MTDAISHHVGYNQVARELDLRQDDDTIPNLADFISPTHDDR